MYAPRRTPSFDPAPIQALLARMRAARGELPVEAEETETETSIRPDPLFPVELERAGLTSPGIVDTNPPAVAGPYPADPLRREIPRAPAPVDAAGIEADERAALERERGPRVKPNPTGWKGFGLGLVKGLVGLAEGYARAGGGNWMDAIGPMAEGASRRIRDYQTNREDYVPFDEELKQRVGDRVRGLETKYGQDRRAYEDALEGYKLDTERDRYEEGQRASDRAFDLQRRQVDLAEQYRRDQLDRQREADRLAYNAKLEGYRTQLRIAAARSANAAERGQLTAQTKFLDKRVADLDKREQQLVKELEELNKQKGRRSLQGDAGTLANINGAIAAKQADLDRLRTDREGVLSSYGQLASAHAAPAGAASSTVTPELRQLVDQIVQDPDLSEDEKRAALADLGFQSRGGQ